VLRVRVVSWSCEQLGHVDQWFISSVTCTRDQQQTARWVVRVLGYFSVLTTVRQWRIGGITCRVIDFFKPVSICGDSEPFLDDRPLGTVVMTGGHSSSERGGAN